MVIMSEPTITGRVCKTFKQKRYKSSTHMTHGQSSKSCQILAVKPETEKWLKDNIKACLRDTCCHKSNWFRL
jgi:hypothetical protein